MPGLSIVEIGELYRRDSRRLLRIVRGCVRAPATVVEDACQVAWGRLLHNRQRVRREAALSWLTTTALHEAVRLAERTDRELSLESMLELGTDFSAPSNGHTLQARAEARERLRTLELLPQRQQRLLWLYGMGLSYAEIACRQGCSSRTVERQLRQARASLRSA